MDDTKKFMDTTMSPEDLTLLATKSDRHPDEDPEQSSVATTKGHSLPETLAAMMPVQNEIIKILCLIDKNNLGDEAFLTELLSEGAEKYKLPTTISRDDITSFHVICGAQSAGKTALTARLIGEDALVSTHKVGSRYGAERILFDLR